jgi:hypothetical protein
MKQHIRNFLQAFGYMMADFHIGWQNRIDEYNSSGRVE